LSVYFPSFGTAGIYALAEIFEPLTDVSHEETSYFGSNDILSAFTMAAVTPQSSPYARCRAYVSYVRIEVPTE
jgi:hypothetical protein